MIQLLPHSLSHTLKESGTSCKDDILEQVFLDIIITFLHRTVGIVLDTLDLLVFRSSFLGLEHDLSCFETLGTNQDFPTIGKLVIFFPRMRFFSRFFLTLVINNYLTHLLFNVFDDFEFSIGLELETFLIQYFAQVLCDISTSNVNALDGMRNCVTFINGNSMRNTIT